MFNNIGAKIKGMAKFFCWIGIIISFVAGIGQVSFGYGYGGLVALGIVTIVVGSIASWLGSLVMYGFGQLVDDVSALRNATGHTPTRATYTGERMP